MSQHGTELESMLEPLGLMAQAARDALADTGAAAAGSVLDRVLVPIGRWNYGDAGRMVASGAGFDPSSSVAAAPGVSQQTLLSDAASAIAAGDIRGAMVVGGEAGHRLLQGRIQGVATSDTDPAGEPDVLLQPNDKVLPPWEMERGLGVMPVSYYAVMETAWRHAQGLSVEAHAQRMADRYAGFSQTASANPHGWDADPTTAAAIAEARVLAAPYRKHHVSNWNVDQASALVLMAAGVAEELGIDRSRWIFPQAFTEANHMVDVSARRELHRCVGAEVAGPACLDAAGCTVEDLDLVELYTCFPNAIETYASALGLADDAVWSFTGAMPFAGGPFNNFVLHSVAQAVHLLRERGDGRALVTTVSGVLTKQGFAVLGTEPGPNGYQFVDATEATAAAASERPVDPDHRGTGTVAGYTVVHTKAGPEAGVVVADIEGDRRAVAMTTDPAVMSQMEAEEFVGRTVELDVETFTVS